MTRRPGFASAVAPVVVLSAACQVEDAGPPQVFTDGLFPEWEGVAVAIQDPEDTPVDAAIDIGAIRILDDSQFVHLDVDVRRRVSLQSMAGTLHVIFDADGDDATGATVRDVAGADLVLEVSMRADGGTPDDRSVLGVHGAGVGIRHVSANGPGPLRSAYDLGLLIAPTRAASRFELRLRRTGLPPDLGPLWTGDSFDVRFVFEDASGDRDETVTTTHRLRSPNGSIRAARVEIPTLGAIGWDPTSGPAPRPTEGTFRVVHWNVAHTRFTSNLRGHAQVLAALSPDVIMLDEVYGEISPETLELFFDYPSIGPSYTWTYVLSESGGTQRALVATRHFLRPDRRLLDVRYREGILESLQARADSAGRRNMLVREQRSGISTVGAWVATEVGGPLREILFLSLDLQSGGYIGSVEDGLRIRQAVSVADVVKSVMAGNGGEAGIVIGGDLNLVGHDEPLHVLRMDLGPDGRDLTIVRPYGLADRTLATWSDARDIFVPGQLDYLLYSGGALDLLGAFVFDYKRLSDENRRNLGIMEADVATLSDHFPLVADFRWRYP